MHAVTNNRKVSCLVSGLWWAVMNPSTKWMQWVYIHISWAKSMGSELPNFLNKNRGELLLKYTFIFNKHIAMIKIKELCKISYRFSSVQFSHTVLSDSLWPHKPQHSRPPCPSPTPGVHPNPCPSSQWCHPTILSSVTPFSSCPNLSQHQGLFKWVSSSHQVAKMLEFQLQHQSFQWTPRTHPL